MKFNIQIDFVLETVEGTRDITFQIVKNPYSVLRTPQTKSLIRAINFNRENVSSSYNKLSTPSTVTNRPLENEDSVTGNTMNSPTLNETHLDTNNLGRSSKLIPTEDKPDLSKERHTNHPPPLQTELGSTALITPEILKPFPKAHFAKPRKEERKRRKITIVTDTPEKMILEEG
ncbi:hypothetical protein PV325_003274, partial [Microctonus aethiopoides]